MTKELAMYLAKADLGMIYEIYRTSAEKPKLEGGNLVARVYSGTGSRVVIETPIPKNDQVPKGPKVKREYAPNGASLEDVAKDLAIDEAKRGKIKAISVLSGSQDVVYTPN